MNGISSSGISIPNERKKAFHAFWCAGWLSTMTPSRSKIIASKILIALDLFSAPRRMPIGGSKGKLRGAILILAKEWIVDEHAGTGKIKSEFHLLYPLSCKGFSHRALLFFITVQQHKTSAARACDLATHGAALSAQAIQVVNRRVGNPRGDLLFVLPAFMQKQTKRVQ